LKKQFKLLVPIFHRIDEADSSLILGVMLEQPKSKRTERSQNFLKATQVLHKAQKLVQQQQELNPLQNLLIYRRNIKDFTDV